MATYLNIIHYCLYKFLYRLHLATDKVNPFKLLLNIPIIKKKAKKEGVNLQNSINEAWGNKVYGLSVSYAGGLLWGLMGLFFVATLILLRLPLSNLNILIIIVLSGVICHFSVFKNNKYLLYFKKYEKWSKAQSRKYSWLTAGSVLFVLFTFMLCFVI